MPQLCSREPFNDDPRPYVLKYGIAPLRVDEAATLGFFDNYIHDPRPEYDRPQTNPTNTLLVYLRTFLAERSGNDFTQEVRSLLEALDNVTGSSPVEIEHTRTVLTRLLSASAHAAVP